jgi:hypothetical protein
VRDMVMPLELCAVTMAWNLKTLNLKPFCSDLGLEHQFSSPYVACQNGVVERENVPFVRWIRRCLMSI